MVEKPALANVERGTGAFFEWTDTGDVKSMSGTDRILKDLGMWLILNLALSIISAGVGTYSTSGTYSGYICPSKLP